MGQPAEQTVMILDEVAKIVEAANPDVVSAEPNYWWLMLIGVVPVVVGALIKWNKKKP